MEDGGKGQDGPGYGKLPQRRGKGAQQEPRRNGRKGGKGKGAEEAGGLAAGC